MSDRQAGCIQRRWSRSYAGLPIAPHMGHWNLERVFSRNRLFQAGVAGIAKTIHPIDFVLFFLVSIWCFFMEIPTKFTIYWTIIFLEQFSWNFLTLFTIFLRNHHLTDLYIVQLCTQLNTQIIFLAISMQFPCERGPLKHLWFFMCTHPHKKMKLSSFSASQRIMFCHVAFFVCSVFTIEDFARCIVNFPAFLFRSWSVL